MSELLEHRGPDSSGIVGFVQSDNSHHKVVKHQTSSSSINSSIGLTIPECDIWLGHNRLAIVDLTAKGHQPMHLNEAFWISFNGEIYNHEFLRNELKRSGYSFHSNSDTEVVLAAFSEWGISCFERFNGMWAIAIFDVFNDKLILARDRFGIKPLYYYVNEDGLYFASEIKAFKACKRWPEKPKANIKSVRKFIATGQGFIKGHTFFDDVFQVECGNYIEVDINKIPRDSGDISQSNWHLQANIKSLSCTTGEEAELFSAALKSAIEIRMTDEVEMCSCLSGGIDSSAVASIVQAFNSSSGKQRLSTFTCGYNDDSSVCELEAAGKTANVIGVKNISITLGSEDLSNDLNKIVWHQEEPFISTSVFAQWSVYQQIRRSGFKVAFDGQGADEYLMGYSCYLGLYLNQLLSKGLFKDLFKTMRFLLRDCAYSLPRILLLQLRYHNKYFYVASLLLSIESLCAICLVGLRHTVYAVKRNIPEGLWDKSSVDTLSKFSDFQMEESSLPLLLKYADKNSMAFSVESRLPFLDNELVDFCRSLRTSSKVHNGVRKAILRSSLYGLLPNFTANNHRKLGFASPEAHWARTTLYPLFRDEIDQFVRSHKNRVLANAIVLAFWLFRKGVIPYQPIFWRLVSVNMWSKHFSMNIAI